MENMAERLNSVIDYIEKHLTEEIDQAEIEKIACCSYYDVARIFSLIAESKCVQKAPPRATETVTLGGEFVIQQTDRANRLQFYALCLYFC